MAAKIFGQVIEALICFHEQSIAHRDLKPENLMVLIEEGKEPLCKVIDFGFAAKAHQRMKVFCGTPAYMSPEIASNQTYDGMASDMWAAGIMLYAMLFGYQPFEAANEADLLRKIQNGKYALPSVYQIQKTKRDYSPPSGSKTGANTGRRKRTQLTIQKFNDYPDIENTALICNLLTDLL